MSKNMLRISSFRCQRIFSKHATVFANYVPTVLLANLPLHKIQTPKTCIRQYSDTNLPSDYGKFADPSSFENFYQWIADSNWIQSFEWYLTTVHDLTGAPWWLSILVCTFAMRSLIMTPLMVIQLRSIAKHSKVMPLLQKIEDELKKEVQVAKKKFNWDERTAYMQYRANLSRHQKNVFQKHEVPGVFRRYLLPWVQIPLWMSLSISMRDLTMSLPSVGQPSMEQLSVAGQLSTEGCLWFSNLCAPDPYFILPVLFCVANLSVIEIYRGDGKTPLQGFSKFLVYTVRGLSVILLPIACQMPAGVVLYWTYSSVYGVLQSLLLQSRKARQLFKIPIPLNASKTPYRDIFNRLPFVKL